MGGNVAIDLRQILCGHLHRGSLESWSGYGPGATGGLGNKENWYLRCLFPSPRGNSHLSPNPRSLENAKGDVAHQP